MPIVKIKSLKSWKKPLFFASLYLIPSLSLALVACGETTITQQQVNDEQSKVNDLFGLKEMSVNAERILQVNDQPFTPIVAHSFGIDNFVPNSNFVYLYSHPELTEDGTLNLVIIVKTDKLVATNGNSHAIHVTGINLQKLLNSINESTITGFDKAEFPSHVSNQTLNSNLQNVTIKNKIPDDQNGVIELILEVDYHGTSHEKVLKITGFWSFNVIEQLRLEGQNATSNSQWSMYLAKLKWSEAEDLEMAKNGIDWSTTKPYVKDGGFKDLKNVVLPEGFVLPNVIVAIGKEAFKGLVIDFGFKIPPLITIVEDGTFANSVLPKDFRLNSSIVTIERNAFSAALINQGFVIPDSVTKLGFRAFVDTILPENFSVPNSVTSLGDDVFRSSRLPSSFTLPDTITILPSGIFSGSIFEGNFSIPNSVQKIGTIAFAFVDLMAGFTIPRTATMIDQTAFFGVETPGLQWYYLDANGQADLTHPAPGPEAGTILVSL